MSTEKKNSKNRKRHIEPSAPSDRRAAAVAAAIDILYKRGAHGLTHRELDHYLEWPVGSTSNYFRRRSDIFIATAERVMQMDLEDLSVLESDDGPSDGMSIELLSERMAALFKTWMRPVHRGRAFARAEILFESTRNAEVRAATEAQIGLIEAMLCRIFVKLGSTNPVASAKLCALLGSSLHMTALLSKQAPKREQIYALIHSWITIAIEREAPAIAGTPSAKRRKSAI